MAAGQAGADVVYAVRSANDSEGRFKVQSARFFYWLLNKLSSLDLPHGGADFRYMSRRTVEALESMPERNRFLRGMTRWIGFEQTIIEYDREVRTGGASKYTLRRMLRFALDAIAGFSALPLRLSALLGFAVSLLGFAYLVYVLAIWVGGHAVAGWTSVIVAVLLLGGVQLICIGIMGQYLGRMFEETKQRPLYLVSEDTRRTPDRERV
jgi:glycosyltransferase involved in cell wall biosynthesis